MERLAARGWHNSVSPPLGLREVARTQQFPVAQP
jgi:hypothetical protein